MLTYGLGKRTGFLIIINIALSILLVFSLLILLRDLLNPGFKIKDSRVNPLKGDNNGRIGEGRGLKDYEPILKNNPFGFQGGELRHITAENPMPLEMRLIGTVSGGPDYAIFMSRDGKQEVFKKGERIFNSGILEKVYADKVVINEGGMRRNLPLSDIITIETKGPEDSRPSSLARRSGNNSFIISQEGILHAIDNPAQLMTDARLQPNYVNGRQEGFMLREVRSGGIYQSLGLQNGDVLLRINSYEITNPEIALQALTALKGMDRVDLDIIRNGVRMTLTYLIR
jgi:type II secretion system protein C